MRKWKPCCHLRLQKKMKIVLKDESGMTLIELLASIALLSVVLSLVGAVHMFGQKQYKTQAYSASQSNDFAYTLSMISREVRKEAFDVITVSESGDTLLVDGEIAFGQKDSQILKNESQVLAEDVSKFEVILEPEAKGVSLLLISKEKLNNKSKEYQTTIYLRK